MSTVPKLSYAKLGNKAKVKAEVNSVELSRSPGDDIFAQMNQQNLRYIQKEIKLKKNRSEHERAAYYQEDLEQAAVNKRQSMPMPQHEDQGLNHNQADVVQPETQRKKVREDTIEAQVNRRRAESLQKERVGANKLSVNSKTEQNRMYQSLPYQQQFNRLLSIQGNLKEDSSSINNKEDSPNFIEFLDDYISDLHQSKQLDGKRSKVMKKSSQVSVSHNSKDTSEFSDKGRTQYQKHLRASYQTFGRPQIAIEFKPQFQPKPIEEEDVGMDVGESPPPVELLEELRKEKYNCIMLAKQIERLREQNLNKDVSIQELSVEKALLQEEVHHMKRQQQIKNSGRLPPESHRLPASTIRNYQKKSRHPTSDENIYEQADDISNLISHTRHSSVNPSIERNRHKQSLKGSFFRQFAEESGKVRRNNASREASLERWEREWRQFDRDDEELRAVANMRRGRNPRAGFY